MPEKGSGAFGWIRRFGAATLWRNFHETQRAFAVPRPPRAVVASELYHVLNRGNGRMAIFHKDADYEVFERVLDEGLRKCPVDLTAYQWMPNHWHMV